MTSSSTGSGDITCSHFAHSELPTSIATGPPRVRPWRTPPRKRTSSRSNFIRAPRPAPSRRRARSSPTSADVTAIPAGRPSAIVTRAGPCDSPAVNQRTMAGILPEDGWARQRHAGRAAAISSTDGSRPVIRRTCSTACHSSMSRPLATARRPRPRPAASATGGTTRRAALPGGRAPAPPTAGRRAGQGAHDHGRADELGVRGQVGDAAVRPSSRASAATSSRPRPGGRRR